MVMITDLSASLAIGHPVGNFIPIEQVRDEVAAAYKQEEKWKTDRLLLPFRNMCAQRRVGFACFLIL